MPTSTFAETSLTLSEIVAIIEKHGEYPTEDSAIKERVELLPQFKVALAEVPESEQGTVEYARALCLYTILSFALDFQKAPSIDEKRTIAKTLLSNLGQVEGIYAGLETLEHAALASRIQALNLAASIELKCAEMPKAEDEGADHYAQGKAYADDADTLNTDMHYKDHAAFTQMRYAEMALLNGKTDDALKHYKNAHELFGAYHIETGNPALHLQGRVNTLMSKLYYQLACERYDAGLEAKCTVYGDSHPSIATTLLETPYNGARRFKDLEKALGILLKNRVRTGVKDPRVEYVRALLCEYTGQATTPPTGAVATVIAASSESDAAAAASASSATPQH